jgi:hypothetical protein
VEHNFGSSGEDARLNCKKTINTYGKHPEFYDKDGDLIDEEIVSVRFEPGYFDGMDDEDDDEEE